MPATTQEALSTPLLSLMQKMRYRSFLSNVLPMEIPGEGGVPADKDVPLMHMTMRELYKKYGLDENCQEFTGHAMALRLMAALRPEDIYDLNTAAAADVTAEQLAAALNGAAEHNISQEAALAAGYDGADRYVTFLLDQGEVYVSAGEPQNIVQVMVGLGTVYYQDTQLYALLRGR